MWNAYARNRLVPGADIWHKIQSFNKETTVVLFLALFVIVRISGDYSRIPRTSTRNRRNEDHQFSRNKISHINFIISGSMRSHMSLIRIRRVIMRRASTRVLYDFRYESTTMRDGSLIISRLTIMRLSVRKFYKVIKREGKNRIGNNYRVSDCDVVADLCQWWP